MKTYISRCKKCNATKRVQYSVTVLHAGYAPKEAQYLRADDGVDRTKRREVLRPTAKNGRPASAADAWALFKFDPSVAVAVGVRDGRVKVERSAPRCCGGRLDECTVRTIFLMVRHSEPIHLHLAHPALLHLQVLGHRHTTSPSSALHKVRAWRTFSRYR